MARCAACGIEGRLSKEHLIHRDIARAAVGDFSLEPEKARSQLSGNYSLRSTHPQKPAIPVLDPRDGVIKDLLCSWCNSTWAQELEVAAARHMHKFAAGDVRLKRGLVLRWLAFFTTKMLAYHRGTWDRAEFPYGDSLYEIACGWPLGRGSRLLMARIDSARTWSFQWAMRIETNETGSTFCSGLGMRGLIWMLSGTSAPTTRSEWARPYTFAQRYMRLHDVGPVADEPLEDFGFRADNTMYVELFA